MDRLKGSNRLLASKITSPATPYLSRQTQTHIDTASLAIYGIRHHGPGSARGLGRVLAETRPDLVLIEGPPDADALIPLVADSQMEPPVALLVYNPKQLAQAAFYPFAEFSPEWQAMRYALQEKVAVRFMDLPLSLAFAWQAESEPTPLRPGEADLPDPFTELARLGGYTDPERWWEAVVERSLPADAVDKPTDEAAIFVEILDLMRALREANPRPETFETLLREAYMRQTIRAAQKEGFQRIAVVCGAWHAPALADTPLIKATADAGLLKGLKKVRTEATWIPWSFDRLANQSGYAAGIIAPIWYRLLFRSYTSGTVASATTTWLSEAARLLREHGIDTSSAHVIEAIRLAESLATLRRTALPGIEELREAAVTVLCEGAEKQLELIDRQLVIGDVLGAVPTTVPVPPLKADFEAQAKSCRLERSTLSKPLHLDLREDAHLRKSLLLHRLHLLGIPWGQPEAVEAGKQGRFHEHWTLHWQPDYEIRLLEAGTWGNTVLEAATAKTRRQLQDTDRLTVLTGLLGQVLKADLPAVLPPLLEKLRNVAALARDALVLAETLPPLIDVLRYGHARRLNLDAIAQLLAALVPRCCLQLPAATIGLADELADDVLSKMLAVNRALAVLGQADYLADWHRALAAIGESPGSAPLLAGLSQRLRFDQNLLPLDAAAASLRFRLSAGQSPAEAGRWLEGFLQGSGLLLIHHAALRLLLDDWMADLPEKAFQEILPVLRRTFSRFTGPEREKMLDLARQENLAAEPVTAADEEEADQKRVAAVLPLLRSILGQNPA